jgi:hypothetical protein
MGVLLEPTPQMGTWSGEVFVESACLRSSALVACVDRDTGTAAAKSAGPGVELPVFDPQPRAPVFEVPAREVDAVMGGQELLGSGIGAARGV